MRISDWSSDVCSSDLPDPPGADRDRERPAEGGRGGERHRDRDRRRHHQRGGKLPAAAELHHAIADGEIGEREQDELRRDGPGQARHRRRIVAEGEGGLDVEERSEEHTSELQSLMRTSYAVFCLKTT